jgi:hypothetical protein
MHGMFSDGTLVPYPPYGGRSLPDATLRQSFCSSLRFPDAEFQNVASVTDRTPLNSRDVGTQTRCDPDDPKARVLHRLGRGYFLAGALHVKA